MCSFVFTKPSKHVVAKELHISYINEMEWNKQIILTLIDIYRKQEILWDPKHPHHYNKLKKQSAWEDVSKQIGISSDDCKKKMENLLAALRREKMKITKSTKSGKGSHEVYTSSWFAFESLRFLWDKNKPRGSLNTLSKATTSKCETTSEDTESEEPIIFLKTLPEETSKMNRKMPTPKSSKKKKIHTVEEQRHEKQFEIPQSTTTVDDSYHFGNLVASKLRTYDDENVRCAIQRDILNIFLRAGSGYYNRDAVLTTHVGTSYSNSSSPAFSEPSTHQTQ